MTRARVQALFGTMVAVAFAWLPAAAWACPACAGRGDGSSLKTLWVLASMILVPFAVAGVVVRIVRRIESDSSR